MSSRVVSLIHSQKYGSTIQFTDRLSKLKNKNFNAKRLQAARYAIWLTANSLGNINYAVPHTKRCRFRFQFGF